MLSAFKSIFNQFKIVALENGPDSREGEGRFRLTRQPVIPSMPPIYLPPVSAITSDLLDLSAPKVDATKDNTDADSNAEITLIPNTPCFYSVNEKSHEILQGIFDIPGQARFKFCRKGLANNDFRGAVAIPLRGDSVNYHLHCGVSPLAFTHLAAFYSNHSVGFEAGLSNLIDMRLGATAKCTLATPSREIEMQLENTYEADNFHVTSGVCYSQSKTEDNRYYCGLLLRQNDFFLGYAWKSNLVPSETCTQFCHEHKVSLGWTARDYIVNFTASSLCKHSFLFYQFINSKFEQGLGVHYDQSKDEILTELAVRWKMEPEAKRTLTFKIRSDCKVALGFEAKIHEQVKMTGAVGVSTKKSAFTAGLGFELEI